MQTRQLKKTFLQFLGQYLLLALLPLLCVVLLYLNDMSGSASKFITQTLETSTRSAMQSLESHLSIIRGYPRQLAQSKTLSDYRYDSSSMNRLELIAELKHMVGENDMVVNLFVYFRSQETFVSAYSNSWDRAALLEGQILRYDEMSAVDYGEMLSSQAGETVIPAMQMRQNYLDSRREVVTFMSGLPVNNSKAYAATVTLVDGTKLRSILQSDGEDAYLLADQNGRLIIAGGEAQVEPEELLAMLPEGGSGAVSAKVNGREYILTFARSSAQGYTLARLASIQPIMEERNGILTRVTLMMLALAVLIAVLIMLSMRRTFTPLRGLTSMAMRTGGESGGDDTAFGVIRHALRSLETENIQLSTRVEHTNPILAEYAARTLLSTPEAYWNSRVYVEGQRAGLRMNHDFYRVMVLQFDTVEEQAEALKSIVELSGDEYVASFPETIKKRLVLLLGGEPDAHLLLPDGLLVRAAGLGPVVNSVRRWNESYIRASFACDYAADREPGRITAFEDITENIAIPSYPWEAMHTLLAAINQSNTDMVRTAGIQIQEYIRHGALTNTADAQTVFLQALAICRDAMPECAARVDACVRMLRLEGEKMTGECMADMLAELLGVLCRREESERAHRENSPVYRSLSIISEEIGSEHLSLQYVAERVGLSVSRYSTLFRQEMDRNFKEYVDSLRLNLAKQLLRTTELQVGAVAARVGYQNAYSFARFFKGKTGMTPNEYREAEGP